MCPQLGKSTFYRPYEESNDNVLPKSRVVKELLLGVFVNALLLITRFSVPYEKEHWKTNKRLGTAQNGFFFLSKRLFQLQNNFPQYLENQF